MYTITGYFNSVHVTIIFLSYILHRIISGVITCFRTKHRNKLPDATRKQTQNDLCTLYRLRKFFKTFSAPGILIYRGNINSSTSHGRKFNFDFGNCAKWVSFVRFLAAGQGKCVNGFGRGCVSRLTNQTWVPRNIVGFMSIWLCTRGRVHRFFGRKYFRGPAGGFE